jgi:hypothetical protein
MYAIAERNIELDHSNPNCQLFCMGVGKKNLALSEEHILQLYERKLDTRGMA